MDSQYKFGVKTKQRPPKNQILTMKMQYKLTNGAPDPTIRSIENDANNGIHALHFAALRNLSRLNKFTCRVDALDRKPESQFINRFAMSVTTSNEDDVV